MFRRAKAGQGLAWLLGRKQVPMMSKTTVGREVWGITIIHLRARLLDAPPGLKSGGHADLETVIWITFCRSSLRGAAV